MNGEPEGFNLSEPVMRQAPNLYVLMQWAGLSAIARAAKARVHARKAAGERAAAGLAAWTYIEAERGCMAALRRHVAEDADPDTYTRHQEVVDA